ncbi:unnamed protein product, partial [Ectocarpus sp. 12 AP-2014]
RIFSKGSCGTYLHQYTPRVLISHVLAMAVGRKPPPCQRGNTGARRPRGRRGLQHSGIARQILFAASPLLLLLIGHQPRLNLGVAAVEVRAEADAGGDWDGLGGRRFGWFRSSNQPSERDYEVAPQQQQR